MGVEVSVWKDNGGGDLRSGSGDDEVTAGPAPVWTPADEASYR